MANSTWEEMEGRSYWELFPDFVGSELDEALQTVAEKRVPTRLEEYYAERGRYYEHRIHPASQGRLSIFSTDITESKKAELAARKTELWLRAIFHQTSGFFAILYPDGRVAQINQAFLDISGYDSEAIVEKPIWSAPWWPAEESKRLRESLSMVGQGERVREVVPYLLEDSTSILCILQFRLPYVDYPDNCCSICPNTYTQKCETPLHENHITSYGNHVSNKMFSFSN